MPSAIERHQQIVARVRAQQAKTKAKQWATRANAPPPPPKPKAKTTPTAKRAPKAKAKTNPGAQPVRAAKPRARKTPTPTEDPMAGSNGYQEHGPFQSDAPPWAGRYPGPDWVWDIGRGTYVQIKGDKRGKGGSTSTASDGEENTDAMRNPRYYGRRRRRRRLLTASDKSDIAFIIGQLGTGQVGRAAISALLSRRV